MPYIETNLENIVTVKKNLIVYYSELTIPDFSLTGEESHNFWEFEYITQGSFGIRHDDDVHILKPGDILFHKPNQKHESFSINPDEPVRFANVSFVCTSAAMSVFEDYHAPLSLKSQKLVMELIEEGIRTFEPQTDGIIAKSIVKKNAPIGGQQGYRIKLEYFLINLLREISQKNPEKFFSSKTDYEKNLLNGIVDYLSENIYSHISLDDMAVKFNYTKSFLCKFFKGKSGISIMNYYNEAKIREAIDLLKDPANTISQISEKMNFTSRYHFSNMFKKITGISPSEYRKTIK